MAPEQVAMNNDQIDTRTDLYGLGAILYEILANRPPAQGTTLEEIYQNVSAGRIPRAREVDLTVPAALDAICAKALSLNRHDRYASASALADEVRRWLIDEPVSVYRDPLTVRLTRWGRKHRTLVTSAAAVLLVAVASFAVFASERSAHASEIGRKNSELIQANTALDAQRRRAEDREAQAIAAVKQFGDVVANEPELKKNPALEALRKRLLKEPLAFFRALAIASRRTRRRLRNRLPGWHQRALTWALSPMRSATSKTPWRPSRNRRRSGRNWPTTIPTSSSFSATWPSAAATSPAFCRRPASRPRPWKRPVGACDPAEAGQRQPRRHSGPERPGEEPQ